MKKKTVGNVVERIREAREQIDRSRYKAYILQELFTGLGRYENAGGPIKDFTLFVFALETIMKEIVDDIDEASSCLTHLTFNEELRKVIA